MKKAVIYARYSAGSGQTDQSIEGQVRECKRYIKQNKMQLVDVYADRHITGRTDRRPEFQRMISDAESDKFDTVVVYTTDRFSRSKYDSVVYKKQLKDLGIDIRYAAENIPEGPEGILLEALMEGWAQYYSEELSRKIRRGMHDTAKKCKATGSTPPIGYKVGADRRYEIDPEVAPHVFHSFEMCLDGCTYADISRYLADHGVLTGKGNSFNCTAVRRMLTSRRYIGEYKYSDVVIEGGMPVIVPEDLFYMVQEKIKKDHPTHVKSAEYYLSGKLFCGLCGSNYKGISGTSKTGAKHLYYKCTGKDCNAKNVPARRFEAFIADEVAAAMRDPAMLDMVTDKIYRVYLEREKEQPGEPSDPEKKLARIEKSIDAIVYSLEKRPGSESLLQKLDALEEERQALRTEISLSKNKKSPSSFSREAFREGLQVFLEGFDFDNSDRMVERILDAFVRKVVKANEKILVELNLTGVDPLELEDLIEFDQNSDWWSSLSSGRTLICGTAAVLVIEYAA